MVQLGLKRLAWLLIAILIVGISLPAQQSLASARQQPRGRGASGGKKPGDDKGKRDQGKKQKKEEADDEDSAPAKVNKDEERIRWGQRRNETDAQYDKRYAALLKKVKQDKRGDLTGGFIRDARGEQCRLWTYMGNPFVVRSDIDAKFTADTAMYMENLHREYSTAYQILLGEAADIKEKVEIIVYADQNTYMANGGTKGSGGQFNAYGHLMGDRGPGWPARRYRLEQFTDGITDFAHWPKGTLKHESAHMELQLRLGNKLAQGADVGLPKKAPLWFNEGQATCFEWWDFDKTVEENFAEIPRRGRYAPFIRRMHDTPLWQDFNYVWEIDPATWHAEMTNIQGYFNYCQAWSLVAYMMNEGKAGRRDFRAVYDLSKRVGVDEQTTYKGDRKKAWEEKFPEKQREQLEKDWNAWVAAKLPRDERVPDEEWYLRQAGFRADVTDRLEHLPAEEWKKLQDNLEREEQQRRKEIKIEK